MIAAEVMTIKKVFKQDHVPQSSKEILLLYPEKVLREVFKVTLEDETEP